MNHDNNQLPVYALYDGIGSFPGVVLFSSAVPKRKKVSFAKMVKKIARKVIAPKSCAKSNEITLPNN